PVGAAVGDPGSGGPPPNVHAGDRVEDHGVAATAPLPEHGVWIEAITPSAVQELGLETQPDGSVAIYSWGDDSEAGDLPIDPVTLASTNDPCKDDTYNLLPWKWNSAFKWYFKADTAPAEITESSAIAALKEATQNIKD